MSTIITQGLKSAKLISQGYSGGATTLLRLLVEALLPRYSCEALPEKYTVEALPPKYNVEAL